MPSNIRTMQGHIAAPCDGMNDGACVKKRTKQLTYVSIVLHLEMLNEFDPGQDRGKHKILLFSILL